MIRRLVEASVDHSRVVVALTAILAAIAVFFAVRLELDALPDLTNNQVIVLAMAPGMTPEEIERLVARPLETATGGAPGLVETRSLSRTGVAAITLVFDDTVPVYLARQLVQERLTSLSLPPSVQSIELAPVTGGLGEIFHFTLSSPTRNGAELIDLVSQRVAPAFKSVAGVVEVNTWGGAQRTFEVIADPLKLGQRDISVRSLAEALERSSGQSPGAALPSNHHQVLLRGVALPSSPFDLSEAIVEHRRVDNSPSVIRVSDVAQVSEGQRVRLGAATKDGRGETVYVMLQMLRGANALDVMQRIHGELPRVRRALPEDVTLDVVYDRSTLVIGTLKTVGKNLAEGGLLVVAVLFLLLGSWRAGLLVALAIPLSMAGATALMSLFDIPGNLMSLGAIDFGLLVDGAVVMVEGVFHVLSHEVRASDRSSISREQIRACVRDVCGRLATPVFVSILIILLVYVPVLALSGVDGKLFRPMALTVVFALGIALVLSLTFIPAAASLFLRGKDLPTKTPWAFRSIERWYPTLIHRVSMRPWIVAVAALLLLALGGGLLARSGTEFTPELNEGDLVVQTNRSPDISIETAISEAGKFERVLLEAAPEVKQVVSRIGSPAVATDIMGIEQGDVFVALAPRDKWRDGLTIDQLIDELSQALEAQAPGGEPSFTQPIQMRFNELLGGAVSDVTISIYGESLSELARLCAEVRDLIANQPGVADAKVLAPPNVPLATVTPRRLDAASVGLDATDILQFTSALQQGVEVGSTYRGMVRIPLMLKVDHRASNWSLGDVQVPTSGYGSVPLKNVADIVTTMTPGQVNRRNGERRLLVGFNVRGGDLGTVVRSAEARVLEKIALPRGYRVEWGGQFESLQEAERRLAVVIPVVLTLILGVAIVAFRRILPVVVILSHVPFSGVGGIVALAARGLPISLSATIGFIALSGIAVLNGVVMLSSVIEFESTGQSATSAVLEAARNRVRPVLMTALVAALGFVPMMLADGPGAEVQRPLATVVVGGLLTSTILTLIILPTLYPVFARLGRTKKSSA